MAENHPTDPETEALDPMETDQEQESLVSIDSANASQTTESAQDTLEMAALQEELTHSPATEATDASNSLQSSPLGESDGFDGIIDPNFVDEPTTIVSHPSPKDQSLLSHCAESRASLNELLAWKEDLRLLAMEHPTLSAYQDNWTKEANLFFRRLVIINRRLETYRKKKRA